AVADRAGDVDPAVREEGPVDRGPAEERDLHDGDARFHERVRGGAAEYRDLGRVGVGEDDDFEYALAVHSGGGADRHDRGHGGAADAAEPRGAAGDAAGEYRRRGGG